MARSILVSLGAGAGVAMSWLRLEEPGESGRLLLLLGLAVVPVLLPRRSWRLAGSAAALWLAAVLAFEVSFFEPGRALERMGTGFRTFYDVALPFDPAAQRAMHGLVLLAIFAFTLTIGLAVRERRAVAATALFVGGAGWPATLVPGEAQLGKGALILAGALALLALVRAPGLTKRGTVALTGGAVVLLALLASTAVAQDQILGWESWDPYRERKAAVGVQYVWDSNYTGIDFPDEPTELLEIAAPGDPRYWRATTLDIYRNGRWLEQLGLTVPSVRNGRTELTSDPDLPAAARQPSRWIEQQVRVKALRDTHLVGASIPVAFELDEDDEVSWSAGGIGEIDGGLRRDARYNVWSYASSPRPRQLAASPPEYDLELANTSYLDVERGVAVPPFGTPGRHAEMLELIREAGLGRYGELYRIARRVGGAATPYGAVVAVETWLRTNPQFVYEEQPQPTAPGIPPLVDFVVRTREGYCQQYAGAMALMLRYLGIPARVAAGFTSGRYDRESETWTVTDRNAHTWVEVWFRGFGWLPFDPTPGRGRLAGPYTSSSLGFRGREALAALGRATGGLGVDGRRAINQFNDARERARDFPVTVPADGRRDGRREEVFAVLLLGGACLAATIAATKLVRRRLRYRGGDARRIASACRLELTEFVSDQNVDVRPAATLEEVGARVRAALGIDPARFVAAAEAARFGREDTAARAARSARRELGLLKRAIRGRLTTGRRARGLVSLRSLRA
jgi:protein-glutamine gamma-glutamyltransferase